MAAVTQQEGVSIDNRTISKSKTIAEESEPAQQQQTTNLLLPPIVPSHHPPVSHSPSAIHPPASAIAPPPSQSVRCNIARLLPSAPCNTGTVVPLLILGYRVARLLPSTS
jgi:hypothetical protein